MWLLRTLFIRAEAWQVVAALRHHRITAPCVFDDAINGERFQAYVEQALAPTLSCGDVIIMDNLPPTRSRASAKRSRPRGRASSTCRPTRPT
jgi:DDE superfamily endonuclease